MCSLLMNISIYCYKRCRKSCLGETTVYKCCVSSLYQIMCLAPFKSSCSWADSSSSMFIIQNYLLGRVKNNYQSMSSCCGYSSCFRWVHISHGMLLLVNWIASVLSVIQKHAHWITSGIRSPKANGYIYKYQTCLLWVLCNTGSGIPISRFPSSKFFAAIFVMQTKRDTSISQNCISKAHYFENSCCPACLDLHTLDIKKTNHLINRHSPTECYQSAALL